MQSRVKLAGHPAHPMLIVFPLGLLSTALAFDIIYLLSGVTRWTEVAYYLVGAGLVGGGIAAVAGWMDWAAIPRGTRAKRVGLAHGIGNLIVLGLFLLSWLLRRPNPSQTPTGAIAIGLVGIVLVSATAWLGGELVSHLGVGVDDGANLDAPNTLSDVPPTPRPRGPERRRSPQP